MVGTTSNEVTVVMDSLVRVLVLRSRRLVLVETVVYVMVALLLTHAGEEVDAG